MGNRVTYLNLQMWFT